MPGKPQSRWVPFLLVASALSLLVYGAAHADRGALQTDALSAAAAVVTAASGVIGPDRAPLTLPVQVANVQRLGATTVQVGFDPARLRVTGCQRGVAFDVGLCNTQVDRNGDSVADAVRFNVVSVNGVNAVPTPIPLAHITWAITGTIAGAITTTLSVEVQTFADADGGPLSVVSEHGQITIAALLTATPTPTATQTPMATATPTVTPTPTATATASPTASPQRRAVWLPLIVNTLGVQNTEK